jgi:hypothetical protein
MESGPNRPRRWPFPSITTGALLNCDMAVVRRGSGQMWCGSWRISTEVPQDEFGQKFGSAFRAEICSGFRS